MKFMINSFNNKSQIVTIKVEFIQNYCIHKMQIQCQSTLHSGYSSYTCEKPKDKNTLWNLSMNRLNSRGK